MDAVRRPDHYLIDHKAWRSISRRSVGDWRADFDRLASSVPIGILATASVEVGLHRGHGCFRPRNGCNKLRGTFLGSSLAAFLWISGASFALASLTLDLVSQEQAGNRARAVWYGQYRHRITALGAPKL